MTREYCDICERDTAGTFEDLTASRKFIMQDVNYPIADRTHELVLCKRCKETLYYYMENPALLTKRVQDMSFLNRLKFLFKAKIKGEMTDG